MKPFLLTEYAVITAAATGSLQVLYQNRWLYLADKQETAFQDSVCNQLVFLAQQHQVPIQTSAFGSSLLLMVAYQDISAFLAAIQAHFPALAHYLQHDILPTAQAA